MQNNKYQIFYHRVKKLSSFLHIQSRYGLQIFFFTILISILIIFKLQQTIPKYSCHAIVNLKPLFMQENYFTLEDQGLRFYESWLATQERLFTSDFVLKKAIKKWDQKPNISVVKANIRVVTISNTFNVKLEMHSFHKDVVEKLNSVVASYFEYHHEQKQQKLLSFLELHNQRIHKAKIYLEQMQKKWTKIQKSKNLNQVFDSSELANLYNRYHQILERFLSQKYSLKFFQASKQKRIEIYKKIVDFHYKNSLRDSLEITLEKDKIKYLDINVDKIRKRIKYKNDIANKMIEMLARESSSKNQEALSESLYQNKLENMLLHFKELDEQRKYLLRNIQNLRENLRGLKWDKTVSEQYKKNIEITQVFLENVKQIQEKIKLKFVLPQDVYFQQPALDTRPYFLRLKNWWVMLIFFIVYLGILLCYSLWSYLNLSIVFPNDIQQVTGVKLSQSLWKKNRKSLHKSYHNLVAKLSQELPKYNTMTVSVLSLTDIDNKAFSQQLASRMETDIFLLDLHSTQVKNNISQEIKYQSLCHLPRSEQVNKLDEILSSHHTIINCPGLNQTSLVHEAIVRSDIVILLIKIRKNTWNELYEGLNILQGLKVETIALVSI